MDYTFSYDAGADQITLTPMAGDFTEGTYRLSVSEPGLALILDQQGNALADPGIHDRRRHHAADRLVDRPGR